MNVRSAIFGKSFSEREDVSRIRSLFGITKEKEKNSEKLSENIEKRLSLDAIWDELCIAAAVTRNDKQSFFGITLVISVLLFAIPLLLSMPMLALLCVMPILILKMRLESKANQRAQNFEKDYAAFLLGLASSVRTGLDPLQAMTQSTELFDKKSELGKALVYFSEDIDHGLSEDRAIKEFAADIRHPDISMFRAGFMLSRRQGSSLAECLMRLAKVTRQRQSFRRKMKSAVAMQRLSGFGIAGCSILICSIQALSNPKAFIDALHDPIGVKLISFGALLILGGTFWMLRMTKTRM